MTLKLRNGLKGTPTIFGWILHFVFVFCFFNTKTFIDNHKQSTRLQGRPTLKTQKHYRKQQLQNALQNAYLQNKRCLQKLSQIN